MSKKKELNIRDRIYIERCLLNKRKVSDISNDLGLHRSTVYYEIKKGLTTQLDSKTLKEKQVYLADVGQRYHDEHIKNRGNKRKLSFDDPYLDSVKTILKKEKCSMYVAMHLVGENKLCLRSLYNYQNAGFFDGYGICYDRRKKKEIKQQKRYPKGKSIEVRPLEIKKRKQCGHWEMDTVYSGKDGSNCLLVLTERKTRLEIIRKIERRTASCVVNELNKIEQVLGADHFKEMFRTITCDNGVEFMDYEGIEKSCLRPDDNRVDLYYAHAYSSCERGSNENQNKLIRRWIPKGDDISLYSDSEILHIEEWMNNLPRRLFKGSSSIDQCSRKLLKLYKCTLPNSNEI